MVENNSIDLGVVEAPVSNKNLVVETCRMDQMVLIVPKGHPLARERSVAMSRILDYPYICREEGSGTREVMLEHLNAGGIESCNLNIVMELGSPEAVKGAVEAGMGISIISRATIAKELALNTLVAINIDPPMERPFSFVHQKQKFRLRAIEKLLDFARAYCKDHPAVRA
jgi:DNA-binding transcriptional LysR family regulator